MSNSSHRMGSEIQEKRQGKCTLTGPRLCMERPCSSGGFLRGGFLGVFVHDVWRGGVLCCCWCCGGAGGGCCHPVWPHLSSGSRCAASSPTQVSCRGRVGGWGGVLVLGCGFSRVGGGMRRSLSEENNNDDSDDDKSDNHADNVAKKATRSAMKTAQSEPTVRQ